MDPFNILSSVLLIGYICLVIYVANMELLNPNAPRLTRPLLFGVVGMMLLFALVVLQAGLFTEIDLPADMTEAEMGFPTVSMVASVGFTVLAVACAGASLAVIHSARLRIRLKRMIGETALYDPASPVHTAAIVLCLALIVSTLGNLVLGGGLAGMADQLGETGVSLGEAVFNQVLWVVASFLGIGLFFRRSPAASMFRLRLRWPTGQDLVVGVGAGIGMYIGILGFASVWSLLVPPESLAEQTSAAQAVTQAFNTLPSAFLLAVSVAIGEELFFRGALQPVFGVLPTTIFFVLLHTQYTLTPASVGIFGVALVLALVAKRVSVTSAIVAHFVYNFIQLALAIVAARMLGGGGVP